MTISRILLIISLSIGLNNLSYSQCTINSTTGYQVDVTLEPSALVSISPGHCRWGYQFNVRMSYDITYSGSNVPTNLYNFRGKVFCGTGSYGFDLPNNSSSNRSGFTNAARGSTQSTDCATSTPLSIGCNSINLSIQGPGISSRTIDCSYSGSSLPIELGSFTLEVQENRQVLILWETISEINNDYFTIEKSKDGIVWTVIAEIQGAGNSTKKMNYMYLDTEEINQLTYYKLKQTDYDGKFKYFFPIFGENRISIDSSEELNAYPNPFKESLSIQSSSEFIDQVKIYSIDGEELDWKKNSTTNEGGKVIIDFNGLKSGIYIVKLNEKVIKVAKQ